MAKVVKKEFTMCYTLTYRYHAKSMHEAVKLAMAKAAQVGEISNASVCEEATGEEVFF